MLLRSSIKLATSGLLGGIVAITALTGSNLWTYSRLTQEATIGEISFSELSDEKFQAVFIDVEGEQREFFLSGDEWQLDTRVIKWKAWANLLGRQTLYQLDRISGRFSDPAKAGQSLPTLVDLRGDAWVDIWHLAREYPDTLFMVDAQYGSSVFLPMRDGASYTITISNSGVLARPKE